MHTALVSALRAAVICSLAITAVAGTSLAQAAPSDQSVRIDGFAFSPADVSVTVGSSVVWTNQQNGVQHTASSLDGLWDSGALSTSDTFSFTFAQPGDFAYQCNIHPSMRGIVHVVADASAESGSGVAADTPPIATPPAGSSSTAPTAPPTQVATPTPAVPATRPTATPAPYYGY